MPRALRMRHPGAILWDLYARNVVHAAMAGRTGGLIGLLHDKFILALVELAAGKRKRLDPNGLLWHSVLAATGQLARFGDSQLKVPDDWSAAAQQALLFRRFSF